MSEYDPFIQRLNRIKTLSVKAAAALVDGIRTNRFEAQETFISPGNYAGAIYYIQNGLIRGSVEGQEEKLTTWFKKEDDLILPYGIFSQLPSEEYVSAITRTTVYSLPARHLQRVTDAHPELMQLMVMLIMEAAMTGQYRERLLRIPAARDRYNFAAEQESFIFKRVPHYLIASYLNVTKETFSRLNKGLAY